MAYEQIGLLDQMAMQEYIRAEEERHDANADAWAAYYGLFPDPLKVEKGDVRDIVKVNVAKAIVRATVQNLFGTPPDIELPDSADPEAPSQGDQNTVPTKTTRTQSPAEKWLRECLRANNWEGFLEELATSGANTGTPYYKLEPDVPLPNYGNPEKPFFRFHIVDSEAVSITTNPRDIDDVTGYVWYVNTIEPATQKGGKPRTRVDRQRISRNPDGQSWTITDEHSYADDYKKAQQFGNWTTDSVVTWNKPWPPMGHCKNLPRPNEVYGDPDLDPIILDDNRALNFILSNWSRIGKHHASPRINVFGFNGNVKSIDTATGKVWSWGKDVRVEQISPAIDGATLEKLYVTILNALLETSATPAITLGRAEGEVNNPSGTSLKMRLMPLANKTATKRKFYGPLIVELCRRLLELGGFGPNNIVELHWPDNTPTDPVQLVLVLEALQRMGVISAQTVASLSNLDFENELENLKQEKSLRDAGILPMMQPQGAGAQGTGQGGMATGGASNRENPPKAGMPSAAQAQVKQQNGQARGR